MRVLRNGYLSLFDRFSTLSLTFLHKVKIFHFSSLNLRNGLPILANPLTGVGASRKKQVDLQ